MARARLIKPGFFTDEAVASCTPLARILFAGLWTMADKRGRLKDQPQVIGGALLPFDAADVPGLISDLCRARLVIRYEADGRKLLQIRNFEKHQHPHPKEPESEFPEPPEQAVELPERVPAFPEVAVYDLPIPSVPSVPSLTCPSESAPPPGRNGLAAVGRDLTLTKSGPKPKPVAESWSREACDDWIGRFGGTAPGGQIGKAIKPLVEKHGWEFVRRAWKRYLEAGEGAFASPARFAATYGEWAPRAKAEPASSGPSVPQWQLDAIERKRLASEAERAKSEGRLPL